MLHFSKNILFVDDEPFMRNLISRALAGHGFNCTAAASVEEAFRLLEHISPDIILSDYQMPGINGIEAVRRIRKFDTNVYIVMLTVFEESETVLNAIFAGASGYLLKNL